MLGFRYTSPAGWIAALILFFLPWVDISCRGRDGRVSQTTISGGQLAWGGGTHRDNGKLTSWVLNDSSEMFKTPARVFTGILLTGYLIGLLWGIRFAVGRTPGVERGRIGCRVAVGLFAFLVSGVWVLFEHPWPPLLLDEPPTRLWDNELDLRFTAWYFGSYLANLWAIAVFAIEYCRSRDRAAA